MLVVAIDHGDSFVRKLREWGLDPTMAAAGRAKIGRAALRVGADAVVLDSVQYRESRTWRPSAPERWLGCPDFDVANLVEATQAAVKQELTRDGRLTLKVGLLVAGGTPIDVYVVEIARLNAMVGTRCEIVLEPVFDASYDQQSRVDFLDAVGNHADKLLLKCDFGPGGEWLAALGRRYATRWFLRSLGSHFDDFVDLFAAARPFGCTGVVAGTALWGDLGGELIRGRRSAVVTLEHRIDELRRVELSKERAT